jgi:hypothetical protein
MGELLRRRLEDGPIATYGLERGIGSPQSATSPLRTPPLRDRASPFMVSPVGPSPIGSSPIRRSPIVTPKIDEEEQEKENTQGKRPGLAKGLGKVRTFKELRKGKEKDK